MKLDTDVINKLKYRKSRTLMSGDIFLKTADGKIKLDKKGCGIFAKQKKKVLSDVWYGYSIKSKKMIPLNTAWVEKNFDQHFLAQIKTISQKKAAFVSVPPPVSIRSTVMKRQSY